MDNTSKILTFLDRKNDFLIHTLELPLSMQESHISSTAESTYKTLLLNSLPLIVFLKKEETFGLYVDSIIPEFLFKLEANSAGQFRSLLSPEDLSQDFKEVTGSLRLKKYIPFQTEPYSSVVDINETNLEELSTQFLRKSYQLESKIIISKDLHRSMLINRVPKSNIDRLEIIDPIKIDNYLKLNNSLIEKILESNDSTNIQIEMEKSGFTFLVERPINFNCKCSKEQFLPSLIQIYKQEGKSFFSKGNLHIRCDYCKKNYYFSENDLLSFKIN